jgi:hypothetical protein
MQSVWEFESADVKRPKSQAQRAGLFIDFRAEKTNSSGAAGCGRSLRWSLGSECFVVL